MKDKNSLDNTWENKSVDDLLEDIERAFDRWAKGKIVSDIIKKPQKIAEGQK